MPRICARFVLPRAGVVMEDAAVRWRGGRIVSVGRARGRDGRPLPVAVIPGLVNAHCHLDLSALRGAVPAGLSLADWFAELRARCAHWSRTRWRESWRLGARRLAESGTTAVGDIIGRRTEPAWHLLATAARSRLRVRAFLEIIAFSDDAARACWAAARPLLEGRECAAPSLHAPYTVAPGLFDVAARWCAQEGRPLAIHAAETQEEQRLLATGDGPLAEFLRAVGTGLPFSAPPRTGAVEYLERLGALGARTNLIHANYVSDAEIEAIARSGASVVVCPGSYAYFGHRGHRVRDMLAAGVRVALGTDSWASNTDLDMRLEMKRAREEHGLDAWTVFRMATENGAQALFPGERLGVLEPGCHADMTVLDARNVRAEGVADWVTAFRPRVIATIVRGRIAYGARRGFTVPVR